MLVLVLEDATLCNKVPQRSQSFVSRIIIRQSLTSLCVIVSRPYSSRAIIQVVTSNQTTKPYRIKAYIPKEPNRSDCFFCVSITRKILRRTCTPQHASFTDAKSLHRLSNCCSRFFSSTTPSLPPQSR